jgi:hypothetical protein
MAKTLLDLAERMEKIAKALPKAASDLAVETALAIVGDLSFKTPVDTSKALSNWIVTLGAASGDKISPHYPGKGGSTQKASAETNLALAKAVLKHKKPGQPIFITNNLPYIRRLNNGYSGQQPAGFVERSVLIGRRKKANFKLKV